MKYILISVLLVWGCLNNKVLSQQQINCSGVFPHLAMIADQAPRTEAGTGALFPWANRLWVVTYVAHFSATGSGTGLFEINDKMEIHKRPESVVGTYANRLLHGPTNQLIIGPYIIDIKGFTIQITYFLYDCRYDKIPLPLGHHQPAIFFALN